MFHYELIFMFYPNKSMYVKNIITYYSDMIINNKGKIHRLEDWGMKYLAYSINNFHKAYYFLMNIEINSKLIFDIKEDLKINNNILRFLILRKNKSEVDSSIMFLQKFNAVVK